MRDKTYEVVRNPHDNRWKVVELGDEFGCAFADCETEKDARKQGAFFLGISEEEILQVIKMALREVKTKYAEYEISAVGFSRDGEDVYSCENDCGNCPVLCEIGQLNRTLGVGK